MKQILILANKKLSRSQYTELVLLFDCIYGEQFGTSDYFTGKFIIER